MKNFKYTISTSRIMVLCFFILAIACKEEAEELSLSRQFSPSKITSVNGETQVTLTWSASLFTLPGEVTYSVEISDKATDFATPVFTATGTNVSLIVTDDKLAIKKDYYARVKAIGNEDTGDSNWLVSSAFRILGEQFLLPVTTDNVIDKGVKLYWKPSNDLTKIIVTPASGTATEVTLTDADRAATFKIVSSLAQNTSYTAEIFGGAKTKGVQPFKTKLSLSGNIVDLTGVPVTATLLGNTLTSAPSGSTIVLERGKTYDMPTTQYAISKSVTMVSGMDYGTAKATIRSFSSFTFSASTSIDSVVFKDLIIKGGKINRTSYDADYLINSSALGTTIGKVRLENCTVKILRGLVRGQSGTTTTQGTKFNNYLINNCVIDSLKDFSVATASGGSSFGNIKITNSTIYKVRKLILHAVAGNTAIAIESSTLNEVPGGAALATTNFLIDFNAATSGTVSIKDCIIGKTWDELGAGTLASVFRSAGTPIVNTPNSYATSDFTNNSFPLSGLSSYSGASTALFTDPANGNFKIKDANFIGKSSAGDPRWR